LATHQIAGMARAYKIAQEKMSSDQRHLMQCRELFIDTCQDISRLSVNGNSENVFPGILSVSIDGLHAESIIYGMKMVAVSKGSACNSDDDEPSHVLKAMGLSQSEINGTVRFSFGRDTDIKDVEYACSIYRDSVDHLHRLRGDKK
jgi:cysteine desulfurase